MPIHHIAKLPSDGHQYRAMRAASINVTDFDGDSILMRRLEGQYARLTLGEEPLQPLENSRVWGLPIPIRECRRLGTTPSQSCVLNGCRISRARDYGLPLPLAGMVLDNLQRLVIPNGVPLSLAFVRWRGAPGASPRPCTRSAPGISGPGAVPGSGRSEFAVAMNISTLDQGRTLGGDLLNDRFARDPGTRSTDDGVTAPVAADLSTSSSTNTGSRF